MTLTRDQIPDRVSGLFEGRPTRWMSGSRTIGDFDGHERTLEVFEANAREQLDLLYRLRDVRADIERAIGGPLVVVFHTSAETQRLYPEVRAERYRALAARIAEWATQDSSEEPTVDPADVTRMTIESAEAA